MLHEYRVFGINGLIFPINEADLLTYRPQSFWYLLFQVVTRAALFISLLSMHIIVCKIGVYRLQ